MSALCTQMCLPLSQDRYPFHKRGRELYLRYESSPFCLLEYRAKQAVLVRAELRKKTIRNFAYPWVGGTLSIRAASALTRRLLKYSLSLQILMYHAGPRGR